MRKRLTLRFITLILVSLLFSSSIMIISVAACRKRPVCEKEGERGPIITALLDLSSEISNLNNDAFENPRYACCRRKVLRRKVHVVIWQVMVGAYRGALNKLKNDIKDKIKKWIVDEFEFSLIVKVCNIIKLISALCWPIHDIAITGVTASPTEVYTGESVYINVTIANEGTRPETFNINVYYDSVLIKTRTGVFLATCTSITLTFIWDTTDVAEGNYTISANATVVKGETDTEDNAYVDGTVTLVPIPHKGWINGTVIDATTDLPIEDANVTADGYLTLAAANGTYKIEVYAPATYNVKALAEGYYSQIVNDIFVDKQATITIDFALIPISTPGVIPEASFTWSPLEPVANETVTFNATESYDPDGYIVSYLWIFGDGAAGTGEIVEHVYSLAGTYTVTLFVTDNDGLIGSASANVTVSPAPEPPVASFTYEPIDPFLNQNVTFDASASTPDGGDIVSYEWDFGDGTTNTGMIVTHAYAAYGNYTVTLNVTDSEGLWGIATDTVSVYPRPPIADFTFSPLTPYTTETLTFDATASYDPDGDIVWYYWNFGDDTYLNMTDSIAHHGYVDDGTYTVTLVVSDNEGLTGTVSATVTVLNRPPVAFFVESAESVFTGEVISFNASDSYDPDGSVVSFTWAFGDGVVVTVYEPVINHTYTMVGEFNVTLTVTDDDGASSSLGATKTVTEAEAAGWPLALLAAIGLGVAALTSTLVYAFYRSRKRGGSASNPGSRPER